MLLDRFAGTRMRRKSSSTGKAPPGQRQLRVGERIRHILSDILRREHLRDPALENSSTITVTAVDVSPDLKNATAYIMPLGGKNTDPVAEALNKATGYFRTQIGKELDLRHVPKITFKIDISFDEADHIDRLLRRYDVQRDLDKKED